MRARRRLAPLVVALACVWTVLAATPASATPPTVSLVTTRVTSAPEWFTEGWSDPMDFSNPEDLDTTPGLNVQFANASINNGVLDLSTTQGGAYVWLFQSFGPVPIPTDAVRDSRMHPFDANRYTRLSFRMYSPQNANGAILAYNCDNQPSCQRTKLFTLHAGWHTYDLDMTGTNDRESSGLPAPSGIPWSGQMLSVRMQPNISGALTGAKIDWVRFHAAGAMATFDMQSGSGGTVDLWYDTDGDPTNNGAPGNEGASAGILATGLSPIGRQSVDVSMLPPGNYQLFTRQGSTVSALSGTLTIDSPPIPVVVDPNVSGGDDYATTVRGDAWDFNQASDVGLTQNIAWNVSGGQLNGSTAPGAPTPNDPQFWLPLNGPIDATTWHRVSVTVSYDGPFGLQDFGGGMVGRFVWSVDQGNGQVAFVVGRGFITTTQPRTYTFDLRTNPPTAIDEPGNGAPLGWGGPGSTFVSGLRFDPHEDSASRSWHVDSIRLSRDAQIAPTFTIHYADQAWEPGTTVDLFADTDRDPTNGLGIPIVSGKAVTSGVNSYLWNGSGTTAGGSYWIYERLHDPAGNVTGAYAGGQLFSPNGAFSNPFGSLDAAQAGPGQVNVAGWAIDPDTSSPIDVHVYVDGQGFALGPAALSRPDVAAAFPGYGDQHGFAATLTGVAPGPHTVCAYGINTGPGVNNAVGCRSIVVPSGSPFGSLDVAQGTPGQVTVAGWAIDPDTAASIPVHVYADGGFLTATTANLSRPDVASFFPAYGTAHGFSTSAPLGPGAHNLCVYGINAGPGSNSAIGCRTVVVPSGPPFGSLDLAQGGSGQVTVAGWAIDPDTSSPIDVHVYVDGQGFALGPASLSRPDVGSFFPAYGSAHGFSATLTGIPPGTHTVCAYGINVGLGANNAVGCKGSTVG